MGRAVADEKEMTDDESKVCSVARERVRRRLRQICLRTDAAELYYISSDYSLP